MDNIFEIASRKKLTFSTTRGQLSVDQLWDLPLKSGQLSLNSIAVALKSKIGQQEDVVDLVDGDANDLLASKQVTVDKLRFDIVMHIIKVLKRERDERQDNEAKLSKIRILDNAIAEQEHAELTKGTTDELKKRRDEILNNQKPTL